MQNIELQPMSPSIPLEAEYLRLTDRVADGIDGYTCCNIFIDSTTSYKSMAVFLSSFPCGKRNWFGKLSCISLPLKVLSHSLLRISICPCGVEFAR